MSKENLNHIWKETALFMMRLDSEGTVLAANPFALRYVREDCVGQTFAGLIVAFTAGLPPLPELIGASPRLINFNTRSGNPVSFHMGFLPENDGILAIGSPDVQGLERLQTEVLELNRELNDLGRQLQKANAELKELNTLKNQFLGMAAHDLRTPLGAVISFADFLQEEAAPQMSEEHAEFVDIILQSGKRMLQLINDFLDVSIIESGKLSLNLNPINAGTLIQGVRSMIDPVARTKGVRIEYDAAEADTLLDLDGPKIEQVLINLIKNAIEFSVADGRVWISLQPKGPMFQFSIRDEAGGMPPEQCEQLFSPFGRAGTKKTGGERSIGLGLAISKKIVEAHRGRIEVKSKLGVGSVFSFEIPIK